jgi:hypothetical protein
MIDLSDVTFTIPIRIDSKERLENFILILSFLLQHFHTNVIIMEDDCAQQIFFDKPPDRVKYIFNKNKDPLFHKTKLINQLCREANTPIAALYDCDVLFSLSQYSEAAESIRNHQCDLCLPSDSQVYQIERYFVNNLVNDLSVSSLPTGYSIGKGALGGCVFYRKASFIEGGMANEHFKSWGWEDVEMFNRFTKLGFTVKKIPGFIYHLQHPCGINSGRSHDFYKTNCEEYAKIELMNKAELEDYIKTWEWIH